MPGPSIPDIFSLIALRAWSSSSLSLVGFLGRRNGSLGLPAVGRESVGGVPTPANLHLRVNTLFHRIGHGAWETLPIDRLWSLRLEAGTHHRSHFFEAGAGHLERVLLPVFAVE